MKKLKHIIVIAILVCFVVVLSLFLKSLIERPHDCFRLSSDESISTSSEEETNLEEKTTVSDEASDETSVEATDVSPDVTMLFQERQSLDESMFVTEFDNLVLRPGYTVREIIKDSSWHSVREGDVLKAGASGFLILTNDDWLINQLNDEKQAQNGNVVLWVRNYDDEPMLIQDCVVYKYKIDFRGCFDKFIDRPSFEYKDYELGYKGLYKNYDKQVSMTDDYGSYDRYIYGNIDTCQVMLDKSSDDGLFAITVFCNEVYGPEFKGV